MKADLSDVKKLEAAISEFAKQAGRARRLVAAYL